MPTTESKRDRFVRIASKRTNQVLNELRKLGNCSNTRMYEFTDEDVKKIFRAIKKETDRIEKLFSSGEVHEFEL
ncbi:MAG: hypothetical protein ACTSRQ_13695 [Candidatus Thorarchaeota archaeon]